MINFVKGDFFEYDADIRVNTVNCVGVMGKGVALVFKTKYPEMYKQYVKDCKNKVLRIGQPTVWKDKDLFNKSIEIINFPTKDHWRSSSEYIYIEQGLVWLKNYLEEKNNLTVTLPALGCGHGGLDWVIVKELIIKYLKESKSNILVFEPEVSKDTSKKNLSRKDLEESNIKIINPNSLSYPERLKTYTEKDLFLFGDINNKLTFDFALVNSTTPSNSENILIEQFIKICIKKNYSIIFGGTATDNKNALIAISHNLKTAQFIPSGIFELVKKTYFKNSFKGLILSTGNPYKSFDKKEFLPSTINRIMCAKNVIFTTPNVLWLKNYIAQLVKEDINYYYLSTQKPDDDSLEILNFINAKILDASNFNLQN